MTRPLPAAGWYPDPAGAPGRRFWDGYCWSHHYQPAPQYVAVLPKRTNHALHLLLTLVSLPVALLTFGIVWWLWVWIIVAIVNHGQMRTVYR